MESRVYFPSERTCPPDVLRGVRAVDPAAELLYAGRGIWMLGVLNFSWPAYQQAVHAIARLRENGTKLPTVGGTAEENALELEQRARANAAKLRYHQLLLQGYRHIAIYEQNDPDSRIVHDFQARDCEHRVLADLGLDATLQAALTEGDRDKLARINKLRHAIRTGGTDTWRYATRMVKGYRAAPKPTAAGVAA